MQEELLQADPAIVSPLQVRMLRVVADAERVYGVAGAEVGEPGRQRDLRASREVLELGGIDGREVEAGDRLVLEAMGVRTGWGTT